MLDWSKIDNDKLFQRLVNHLFALECNSPGFIPSSPYIGADGGWDGYFNGFFPLEGLEGVWSIQSKWTTKSFSEAVKTLKTEIKKELGKAKHNKVDHLRIATNAELRVDQIKDLGDLNRGEVETLIIWHREELSRRVDLQPYLRHFFFGAPQYPKFVPWDTYFQDIETQLLEANLKGIPTFEENLNAVKVFITSKTKNILLVHSPGGYGKSHLLREISQIVHPTDSMRQIWLIRAGHRNMEDSLQEEIIDGKKYLLIFDDADRYLDEIKPLLSFCKHHNNSIKIILASRAATSHSIYEIVKELRIEEIYEKLNISSWERNDLVSLLRLAAGQNQVEEEELIAASNPNPFLIVWIGKKMRKEPTLDLDQVKEKFINDINYDSQHCLQYTLDQSQTESLLRNLACIVPFYIKDIDVIQTLAGEAEINPEEIKESIDKLVEAGVLRAVGRTVRFNPDMKGDLYLAYELERESHTSKAKQLIKTWINIFPENLFSNLEDAFSYGGIVGLDKTFSEIVNSWIITAEKSSVREKRRLLNLLEKICKIVPDDSLSLLYTFLQFVQTDDDQPGLTTDNFGPILLKLLTIPGQRIYILPLIESLEANEIEGIYGNYRPDSLIRDSVSPLKNDKESIHESLDLFSFWLEEPNKNRIELIAAALRELLAGSHEFTKSHLTGMTFGQRALKDNEDIRGIRDKALVILKAMLTSHDLESNLLGVDVAEEIGGSRMGASGEDIPLKDRIAQERREIFPYITGLVSTSANLKLLSEIEDLLLRWWTQKTPGTEESVEILRTFPRLPEYMFVKYSISPDYAIENFADIEKQAPSEDRWNWFVENVMRITSEPSLEEFKRLAEALNTKYETEEKIAEFLSEAEVLISPHQPWSNPPIISYWIDMNQDIFSSVRADQNLWKYVPERYRGEIDFALSKSNEGLVSILFEEILYDLPSPEFSKVLTFLKILEIKPIENNAVNKWLKILIEKGDSQTRTMVISVISALYKKFNIDPFELLLGAISKQEVIERPMLHNLSYTVTRLQKDSESLQSHSIENFKREILARLKDIPKIDWDAERLLDFCFGSIEAAIDFLNYRLVKHSQKRKETATQHEYEGIPSKGLKCLTSQIKTYSDFEQLIDQLMLGKQENDPWRSYDIALLMKPLKTLSDQGSDQTFLEQYIRHQLDAGRIENALGAIEHMPLGEKTIGVILQVLEKAIESGKAEDARQLLHSQIFPDTAWFSGIGESPPALVERKQLFEEMYRRSSPGILRVMIQQCTKSIQRYIEEHMKEDEEFLNPKV